MALNGIYKLSGWLQMLGADCLFLRQSSDASKFSAVAVASTHPEAAILRLRRLCLNCSNCEHNCEARIGVASHDSLLVPVLSPTVHFSLATSRLQLKYG